MSKALVVTLAALMLVGGSSVAALVGTQQTSSPNPYAVAPYVDMSNSQEGILDTAITSAGLHAYTAAFVIGVGCKQVWGDNENIGSDPFIDPEIAKAKDEGASLIISSGGADGVPVAWTCTDQGTIDSDYQTLIDDYGVKSLDFDVEGAAQDDTAAWGRLMSAMALMERDNPGFTFSITLPVLPTGLTADGLNGPEAARAAGLIPLVNIMTMDYNQGTHVEMGQAAIEAAQSTLSQLKALDPSYSYGDLGVTPMIGVNDDGSTFTLSDASLVQQWASQNGVGRLAFWSIDRDQPCQGGNGGAASSVCSGVSESPLAYTSIFTQYLGPSPTTSTTAGNTGTGGGGTGSTTTTVASGPVTTTTVASGPVPSPGPGADNLIDNPTFSTGTTAGWNCDPGVTQVVTSPTYTGSYALELEPSSSDDASCSQTVQVQANSTYTLSAEVNGSYLFIGATGSGIANATTWVPATNGSYQLLSTSFSTGSSASQVTVFVHGWYGLPSGYVGEVSLVMAGSSSGSGSTTTTTTPTTTTTALTTTTTTPISPTTTTTLPPSTNSGSSVVVNGDFEDGNLTGWTCDPGTAGVTTNPVYSGKYALELSPTGSDYAYCSQDIAVQPNTAYTLSAWVEGNYAFIGDSQGTSNWVTSSSWQQLSTTFTTGPSTSTVTIWVHGWYDQGPVYVDGVSLT